MEEINNPPNNVRMIVKTIDVHFPVQLSVLFHRRERRARRYIISHIPVSSRATLLMLRNRYLFWDATSSSRGIRRKSVDVVHNDLGMPSARR